MIVLIGILAVIGCVIGGYIGVGGKLDVLNQPFEVVIILGAGLSAFVIANPGHAIKNTLIRFLQLFRGPTYKRKDYIDLLLLLYQLLRTMRQRGALAIEAHVDNPRESSLFTAFPSFLKQKGAVAFLCDHMRVITLGTENAHEMETLIDSEIEVKHKYDHGIYHAMNTLAEGFPGLGIVAAVLGVIKTMGSITEPPEVLGQLIAGALVGTFLGVLLCYGFFAPFANGIKAMVEEEITYYHAMKAAVLAYLQNHPPAICVEFARKTLNEYNRPSFEELEALIQELPPIKNQ